MKSKTLLALVESMGEDWNDANACLPTDNRTVLIYWNDRGFDHFDKAYYENKKWFYYQPIHENATEDPEPVELYGKYGQHLIEIIAWKDWPDIDEVIENIIEPIYYNNSYLD